MLGIAITVVDGVEGKICPKCDPPQWKPRSEYHNNRSAVDGLHGYCKSCHKANVAKYRRENAERIAQRQAKWRKENAERIAQRQAKWRKENPEKDRARRLNKRARRAGAPGYVTAENLTQLWTEQRGLCYYCGCFLLPQGWHNHVEHKQPVTRGGSNWPENLCWACASCNRAKYTDTEPEFITRLLETTSGLCCELKPRISTGTRLAAMIT